MGPGESDHCSEASWAPQCCITEQLLDLHPALHQELRSRGPTCKEARGPLPLPGHFTLSRSCKVGYRHPHIHPDVAEVYGFAQACVQVTCARLSALGVNAKCKVKGQGKTRAGARQQSRLHGSRLSLHSEQFILLRC